MPLVPYDPFGIMRRDFGSFPSFPRLFDDDWFESHFANMARIRVDVRESQNEVIVTAEIPGLEKKEDVNITVHDNHLHLSGKIERMGEQKNENVHRMERYYGQFSRTVPLPTAVDDTGAKASYRNGILEVRIPKTQKQIGRQIDVDFH
ncbi:Hsp20/alpha crystallin family protein [Alicyclobacillus fastidiosus]|uniref:Hsp20/alpha crystallin family protein n=1 Tax=Alicyclobacillus fastidiosus TaxID=392011 RepID=A0ABY6ZHG9_9BACL|nr:Hsp20/alpha crystallin family protein [Alicyclobacillus fastidiosus]WAH42317.1 Hsp20/alpha crystallin family protein [Alicyclobacillus fastidiosus]GMA64125.1 heat-shock protein Hsp20 [Alicyclobacillus fastidiosus]